MKAAMHGSQAWSTPWQELQRKLALGIRVESPRRSAPMQAAPSRTQIRTASSWLRRAQERSEPARLSA